MTAIYGAAHFLVDFACAYLMFSGIYKAENWYLCLLLYNFCAFAIQMPMGAFADWRDRNSLLAVCGCVLTAAAYVPGVALIHWEWNEIAAGQGIALAAAVTAGLGNGLFHVGGGLDTLNKSERFSGLLGIFVAPGALGIFFGTAMGKSAEKPDMWPSFLLFLAAFCIAERAKKKEIWRCSGNASVFYHSIREKGAGTAVICLFLVVVLRSYLGMIQNFPWKDNLGAGMILVSATAMGKVAGGFLADIAGMKKTAFGSVFAAGVLYMFSDYPVAGILAVFFWNMTMPLTLWAVARVLPGAKGFSFGLLTFALFLGFCPSYLHAEALTELFQSQELGLGILCGISLVLLQGGMYCAGKRMDRNMDICSDGSVPGTYPDY